MQQLKHYFRRYLVVIRYLLCPILVYLPCLAKAAEVPSIHYTIKDGLPSNTVYDIYQDKDGYIWFATDKGVSRYNGLTFQNYTTDDGLTDNDCLSLYPDLYGRMWILTYNGSLMYYKDGVFHTAANTPMLRIPFNDGVTYMIKTQKDSSVLILFQEKSLLINIQKEQSHYYKLSAINKLYGAASLMHIQKTSANTFNLFYYVSRKQVIIDTNMNILDIKKFVENATTATSIDGNGDGYNVLDRNIYSRDMRFVAPLPEGILKNHLIQRVYYDQDLYIVCTNYGLFVNNRLLFAGKNVTSFIQDKDGNYWISTLRDGVYKVSASFLRMAFISNSYQSPVIYAVRDKQSLVLGTQNRNIYYLKNDSISKLFESHSTDSNRLFSGNLFDGTNYISFGMGIKEPGSNNFILKNKNWLLPQKINTSFNNIATNATQLILNKPFLYILVARRQIIAVDYRYILGYRTYTSSHSIRIHPKGGGMDKQVLFHAQQAPDSSIWFSTANHVYSIKDTTAVMQTQFDRISFKKFITNKDYLVGATTDNKLLICNRYRDHHVQIDSSAANNCIWDKFYRINDSVIIATTNNFYRLIQTHVSGGKPRYSISIPESQFLPQSAEYIFSNGIDCYFFKEQSITRLPVSELFNVPAAPALSFSAIRTADSMLIKISPSVTLSYRQAQNINIGFSAISFNTPDLQYEYAISQNNDKEVWVASGTESINLYKPRSGEYTVKIRAKTPAGTYSKVASFVLTINKPFWLSWWFLLIDAAIIGGLTWLLIKYYTRKATARKEEELQQKEQEMKFLKSEYKALNALMNPHFIFNTLNSVQSLINKDDKQASSEHIRTVADLIRQNMHNVARDLITLEEELTLVINYLKLEQLRFSWLHFELDIDDAIDTDDVMVPPLILQPLVENAILHGLWPAKLQQGIINIRVMKKEKSIVIEIRDNGKGFSNSTNKDRNPNHKSTAVNNISSRMHQLSAMHGKSYTFQIEELKNGEMITGVTATIEIEI